MMSKLRKMLVLAWLPGLASGCQGSSHDELVAAEAPLPELSRLDGADPEAVLSSGFCATPQPGPAPLRRLSNLEYRNTLADVVGDLGFVSALVERLPGEPESQGFRRSATGLNVSTLAANQYRSIASELSAVFGTDCDDLEETACAERFVKQLGLRLYRRPLTPQEVDAHLNLFRLSRTRDPFHRALQWTVTAMLQSPHFLYRVELPLGVAEPPAASAEVVPVAGYAMAARLSYLLWQSLPDRELFEAAARDELETAAQIATQVVRMLQDRKALRVYDFFEQWLDLDRLPELDRDRQIYPGLSPELPALLAAENRAFIQDLLTKPESSFADLLTAQYTFANQTLAEHYGLTGPDSSSFERVEAAGRFGILTQGMLAVNDRPTRTSIVRRGLKIRTDFLCQTVPAPPDSVDLTLSAIRDDVSQRERLTIHRENPSCNVCHQLMDPLGVVFEGFDAVGRKRELDEQGLAVDTSGELLATRELDGEITSVAELAERLAQSREARECFMLQNFRFFYGRDPEARDLCSQAQLLQFFEERDTSLVSMLIGLTQTDAFRYASTLDLVAGESTESDR